MHDRPEVAALYRKDPAFLPLVERALRAGRFEDLAKTLGALARPVLLRIEKQDPYATEGAAWHAMRLGFRRLAAE